MARKAPTTEVLRALFARSGNVCAFPGCKHILVNEKHQFVAQVCHIEAAEPGGQRYNPAMTDQERRSYENLILMCYRHHKETDDTDEYTVARLKAMKTAHEAAHVEKPFKIDEAHLHKLAHEMEQYWSEIRVSVEQQLERFDLAMGVSADSSFLEVLDNVHQTIGNLEWCFRQLAGSLEQLPSDLILFLKKLDLDTTPLEDTPYYENPFEHRQWEVRVLGVPNNLSRLRLDLCHLEIKFLEEYLVSHSSDLAARSRLDQLKVKLHHLIETTAHID